MLNKEQREYLKEKAEFIWDNYLREYFCEKWKGRGYGNSERELRDHFVKEYEDSFIEAHNIPLNAYVPKYIYDANPHFFKLKSDSKEPQQNEEDGGVFFCLFDTPINTKWIENEYRLRFPGTNNRNYAMQGAVLVVDPTENFEELANAYQNQGEDSFRGKVNDAKSELVTIGFRYNMRTNDYEGGIILCNYYPTPDPKLMNIVMTPEGGGCFIYNRQVWNALQGLDLFDPNSLRGIRDELCNRMLNRRKQQVISEMSVEHQNDEADAFFENLRNDKNNQVLSEKCDHIIAGSLGKEAGPVAIVGDTGAGKTTLAKNLAKKLGYGLLSKTGADLKGAYVGQTSAAVYELILEAMGKSLRFNDSGKCWEIQEKSTDERKIIFIDEAYELMNDDFGREAVSILLPIISGDKDEVSTTKSKRAHDGGDYPLPPIMLDKENRPIIWLGGYEKELRLMLQHNMGLYRRMEKLTIKTPSVKRLENVFWETLEAQRPKISEAERENQDKQKKIVRNFIAWATSPEHSRFFANYAGAEKLSDYVTKDLLTQQNLKKDLKTVSLDKAIDTAITLMKEEIERQYTNQFKVSEKEREKLGVTVDEFRIIHDVPETKVIGYKKVREEMDQIVEMVLNKEHYKDLGIALPKGVLFVGPPGAGKSNMAKYMAYSLQYNKNKYDPDADHKVGFISVVAPELNTPEKVKKLFLEAGEFDDCIIFIDEIDAVAKERDHNFFAPAMYRLMTEMDGFDSNTGILVVAATNAPESLDPAMRRPGRFDREIEISYPEMEDRKALLKEFISRLNIIEEDDEPDRDKDEGILELARKMAYKTAVEIKALVNLASVSLGSKDEAVRNGQKRVSYEELENQILEELDRMDIGERKDEGTEGESDEEKDFQLSRNEGASATAIHEVGHALISLKEYDKEPFAEITVVPRGDALGYVRRDPDEKKQLTRETMLKRIRIALGGRVAEEMFYGENISAGASQDIKDAYDNAWKMVFLYGMSEKIGPIPLAAYENDFLGGNMKYICSDKKRSEGEEEIKAIIERELQEVRDYLKERKELIEDLARKVFEEKTMTGKEFKEEYDTLDCR